MPGAPIHTPSDALVFFGATGDLARKSIFPALYRMARSGALTVPVVGVAHSDWTLADLQQRARESVESSGDCEKDPEALETLLGLLRYVDGDYKDPATFAKLREELGDATTPTHYLAIPPSLFGTVIDALAEVGLNENGRVVVEKPFGRDLASAQALAADVGRAFDEHAVFRIDHFLGKDEIMNLLYFRFANSIFEPIWNRDHISSVQVTFSEDFGVDGRESFYESAGALRDVIENHLFQIVALLTMEAPAYQGYGAVQAAKAAVFKAMRPLKREDLVRGQFEGYRDHSNVAPDSDVETFAAVRLFIDSWRWADVPFYLRTGKLLPSKSGEVVVEFKRPPQALFDDAVSPDHHPNRLTFRLSPHPEIGLAVRVKTPGAEFTGDAHELTLQVDATEERLPYERLLTDALEGDGSLFTAEDSVEAAWRVVDDVLTDHDPAVPYAPGTWGPTAHADALIGDDGPWNNPPTGKATR